MCIRPLAILVLLAAVTVGCRQSDQQKSGRKVIIGATALVTADGPALEDSVIVISGGKIKLVGYRKDAPITQDSERSDLTGKFIVPAPGGKLAENEPANLLILNSKNPTDIARRMTNGEWQ